MTITEAPLPTDLAGKTYEPFRHVAKPLAIVIHVTDGPSLDSALSWFENPESAVSAHYLVDKDGSRVLHLLDDKFTAWHAGIGWSAMQMLRASRSDLTWLMSGVNPNDMTIGIEHVGLADTPWPEGMMEASSQLVASLCVKYGIPINRQFIVGHREVYSLHSCPGACDVDRLVAMAAACVSENTPKVS